MRDTRFDEFPRRRKALHAIRPYPIHPRFPASLEYGIDDRDYEKVDRLPEDIPLMAVAGGWGDYSDIRCLFIDPTGKTYRRHITGSAGRYIIRELDLNAKEMMVGQVVVCWIFLVFGHRYAHPF